ncbi:hypothetical protein AAT19DRAFT_8393 [Rhodotorula toruloides]|uniref:Uncharacterized protein n=1 Tax=Rhodotorula toruloides TaxID=5286 RepID=A0A2T0AH56_RHOTO|nr:hypothetical protein AAT19DRAFT_8393 [Rhodotorula toruloides]
MQVAVGRIRARLRSDVEAHPGLPRVQRTIAEFISSTLNRLNQELRRRDLDRDLLWSEVVALLYADRHARLVPLLSQRARGVALLRRHRKPPQRHARRPSSDPESQGSASTAALSRQAGIRARCEERRQSLLKKEEGSRSSWWLRRRARVYERWEGQREVSFLPFTAFVSASRYGALTAQGTRVGDAVRSGGRCGVLAGARGTCLSRDRRDGPAQFSCFAFSLFTWFEAACSLTLQIEHRCLAGARPRIFRESCLASSPSSSLLANPNNHHGASPRRAERAKPSSGAHQLAALA